MEKTPEERYNEAVAVGWDPNEVINKMRKHKNDDIRSWVKQRFDSPEAIPKDNRSTDSRLPADLDPEVRQFAQQHKTQGSQKIAEASGGYELPAWLTSPDFLASMAAAGTAYTAAGANAGMTPAQTLRAAAQTGVDRINNRMISKYAPPPEVAPSTLQRAQSAASQYRDFTQQQPAQTAPNPEQIRIAKQNAAMKGIQQGMTPAPVAPAAPAATAPVPPQAAAPAAPAAPAPVAPPAPQAPTTVSEALATNQPGSEIAKAVVKEELGASTTNQLTPEVAKKTALGTFVRDAQGNIQWPEGMSPAARAGAEAFAKQYPEIAAQLEKKGQFGILGFGSGDNNLHSTYGPEGRKAVLDYFNEGKPVGPHDPNYENLMSKVRKGVPPKDVSGLMGALPAEAEKGFGGYGQLGKPAAVTPEGRLLQGKNQLPAVLKAGGPALMLLSIADAAKAAQEGDTAPAKQAAFDFGSMAAIAKLFGGPASAVAPMLFGSQGLNQGEEAELAKRWKKGSKTPAQPTID